MILPWLKVQYIFAVPGFFFAHIHLYYEIGKVDFRNGSSCAQFFRKANHFGFFIFLSLLMSYYGNMIYERYLGE